jgi:hypothetical protein
LLTTPFKGIVFIVLLLVGCVIIRSLFSGQVYKSENTKT